MSRETNSPAGRFSAIKDIFHWALFLALVGTLGAGILFVSQVYSQESNIVVTTKNTVNAAKGKTIVVHFSATMLKSSVDRGLKIEPAIGHISYWKGADELHVKPTDSLKPETEYKVTISGAKTRWLVPQEDMVFSFAPPSPPALLDVYPKDNTTEVDVMDTIKMKFDQPIGKDYNVEVMIEPQTGFEHVLDQTERELSIVPKQKLGEGTPYRMEVTLRSKEFEDFIKQVYKGGFVTKKPVVVTYTTDDNGDPVKTEPKKEVVTPKITEGKYIDIDLSSQTLYLFEDGVEKGAYKISSGKKGMSTPEGTFKVMGKSKRPWSKKYSLYMPWFIQFTNMGHGIHELPEWPSGYKEGANHLGTPVSHGCVRLGVGPAKRVYDFAEVGMPIVIHQ